MFDSRQVRFGAAVLLIVAACDDSTAAEDFHPLAPANTSSPYETLTSFRESGERLFQMIVRERGRRGTGDSEIEFEARRFLSCLDISEVPAYRREAVAKRSAVCLLEIFDRIEFPPEAEIPGSPEERRAAEAAENLDLPAHWRLDNTEIVLLRVEEGARAGEYLFSPDTVERAPEFYERAKHLPYKAGASEGIYEWFLGEPGAVWLSWIVHRLPSWFRERYWGQAVWQWIGLVLVSVLGVALMAGAYFLGRHRARILNNAGALRQLITLWAPLSALLVPVLVGWTVSDILVVSGGALSVMKFCTDLVFLLGVVVLVLSLGNRIADIMIASPGIHPRGIDAQFIRIISRVVSLVVAVIVFLEGGQYLGIPLTTLLAGAGVGGLTVALAAQDTLRNVFGSMMILFDKPFRVGERIVVKGYDGTVQEIGLRSTKLRLLTGHEATIPNDELARSDVENVGRRKHIRRVSSLSLPLDLSPEKCEQAVGVVRELLSDHEGMDESFPPRVFLTEFNPDSLNLRFFYWYHPAEYWDFLDFSQRLNLEIKRKFAELDIPFALPTRRTIFAHENDAQLLERMNDEGPNQE